MSAATAVQTAGFGAQGILSGIAGFESAAARREQGRFAEAQFDIAARMTEIQAKDELRVGEEQARRFKRGAKQLASAQRTAVAAQNIDVLTGSAAQAGRDIDFFSDLDEITIRDMARQRALGLDVRASDFRFQGLMARQSAEFQASQAIFGGIASAIGGFSRAGLALSQGLPGSRQRTLTPQEQAADGALLGSSQRELRRARAAAGLPSF